MKNLETNGIVYMMTSLSFPRAYFPHLPEKVNDHLYVFADASTKAYGAIVLSISAVTTFPLSCPKAV